MGTVSERVVRYWFRNIVSKIKCIEITPVKKTVEGSGDQIAHQAVPIKSLWKKGLTFNRAFKKGDVK